MKKPIITLLLSVLIIFAIAAFAFSMSKSDKDLFSALYKNTALNEEEKEEVRNAITQDTIDEKDKNELKEALENLPDWFSRSTESELQMFYDNQIYFEEAVTDLCKLKDENQPEMTLSIAVKDDVLFLYDLTSDKTIPIAKESQEAFLKIRTAYFEHGKELDAIYIENNMIFFKSIDGTLNLVYCMESQKSESQQKKQILETFGTSGFEVKPITESWYFHFR